MLHGRSNLLINSRLPIPTASGSSQDRPFRELLYESRAQLESIFAPDFAGIGNTGQAERPREETRSFRNTTFGRAPLVPEVDIARTWLKSNKGGPPQRGAKREWGKDSRAGTKKRVGSRNGTGKSSGSTWHGARGTQIVPRLRSSREFLISIPTLR